MTVSYWDFDGAERTGEIVVHADYATDVVSVFDALFTARFPIAQMRLVDDFGGDDDRSMAANNTSGFNCRAATGSDAWSEHAYGRAIDINPIQNPFVTASGDVIPPAGEAHRDRDVTEPGLITSDGPVVAAFAGIGWQWGGEWARGQDYQHFSVSGR
ncbi:MAG TPA: M15 family metallopeptidase [Acidimicrobiales bacterium]